MTGGQTIPKEDLIALEEIQTGSCAIVFTLASGSLYSARVAQSMPAITTAIEFTQDRPPGSMIQIYKRDPLKSGGYGRWHLVKLSHRVTGLPPAPRRTDRPNFGALAQARKRHSLERVAKAVRPVAR